MQPRLLIVGIVRQHHAGVADFALVWKHLRFRTAMPTHAASTHLLGARGPPGLGFNKETPMNKQRLTLSTAMLLSALAFAGCDKRDDVTPVDRSKDQAVVQGQPNTTGEQVKEDAKRLGADFKEAAREAGQEVKQAGDRASQDLKQASNSAGDKVADAVITTSVNAELAKDSSLSALRINVDTVAGRVALHGTAPSATARDRATQLAAAVKGVVSVDNQLRVEPAKM
ncbi:MAG: hypothetical protein RLZZ618_3753 [Pseudomonadota bacterium]